MKTTQPLLFFFVIISLVIPQTISAQPNSTRASGVVNLDSSLVQHKVLTGSDGKVSVSITLNGADIPSTEKLPPKPVDLVVVLDRSGSMEGQKIHDARKAILNLLERLSRKDRIALISYANTVHTVSPLVYVNAHNFNILTGDTVRIQAGGGTNLGGGLQQAVRMLMGDRSTTRQRKVILISDGLANQGIIDPVQLGAMASNGPEYNFSVSTVGVGYDFNEMLMTTIADHGGGNYYFLEDPQSFARVFTKEFEAARAVIATNIEIHIQLHSNVQLLSSGGYPIEQRGNTAIIRPGDLLSGQQRNFFLTYQVPTGAEQDINLGKMELKYVHEGQKQTQPLSKSYVVSCVSDRQAVISSYDKETWGKKVVREEYSKLKDDVAQAIKDGRKEEALQSITEYEEKNRELNRAVDSTAVADNLDQEVTELKEQVEETFAGAPAAVMMKQKQQSKALQYESYKTRRDKK